LNFYFKTFFLKQTEGNKNSSKLDDNLNKLRKMILLNGLPPETDEERQTAQSKLSLRAKVWLILLRVKKVDTAKYTKLVEKGYFFGFFMFVYLLLNLACAIITFD
jgi:hypothetical protein